MFTHQTTVALSEVRTTSRVNSLSDHIGLPNHKGSTCTKDALKAAESTSFHSPYSLLPSAVYFLHSIFSAICFLLLFSPPPHIPPISTSQRSAVLPSNISQMLVTIYSSTFVFTLEMMFISYSAPAAILLS